MPGDLRSDFEYAWQEPDPEPDEGPGLTWRQLTPRHWSGTWESKIRGTVTRDGDGWAAYLTAAVQTTITSETAPIWDNLPTDDVTAATRVLNEILTRGAWHSVEPIEHHRAISPRSPSPRNAVRRHTDGRRAQAAKK